MLEDEIRKLTAAIQLLCIEMKGLQTEIYHLSEDMESLPQSIVAAQNIRPLESVSTEKPTKKPRAEKAAPAPEKIAEKIAEPAAEPAAPPPADPAPSISKENLKAMALSISRADTSAKPLIFEILGKYGAKTITALPDDPAALYDVFTGFTKIANKIAKDGE